MSDAALLRAFVAGLVAAGVRDAVVCPGSRSTPLALALRANGDVRVRMLLDERAAGFFALGIAADARRPVVLLATSGTAAMNFGPAVVEAALLAGAARRPDRRPAGGASGPRRAADHRPGPPVRRACQVVRRAAALRRRPHDGRARPLHRRTGRRDGDGGPAGPVHLNVPFREPLLPDGPLGPRPTRLLPRGRSSPPRRGGAGSTTTCSRPSPVGSRASSTASSSPARTTTRRSPRPSRRSPPPPAFRSSPTRCPASGRAPTTGAW